jgi:hypothetical protein
MQWCEFRCENYVVVVGAVSGHIWWWTCRLELFGAVFAYIVIIFIQNETISCHIFSALLQAACLNFMSTLSRRMKCLLTWFPPPPQIFNHCNVEVWTRIRGSAVYDYSLNDETLFAIRGRNYSSLLPWECRPIGKTPAMNTEVWYSLHLHAVSTLSWLVMGQMRCLVL